MVLLMCACRMIQAMTYVVVFNSIKDAMCSVRRLWPRKGNLLFKCTSIVYLETHYSLDQQRNCGLSRSLLETESCLFVLQRKRSGMLGLWC